jgi:SAM-dependent methyltransferase
MNDKANPPQVPVAAPAADPLTVPAASSQPGTEVAPEHDTTLKWIVTEPTAAPSTPPPKIEFKRERPTPTLPPPSPKKTAGTVTNRTEATSPGKAELDGSLSAEATKAPPATPPRPIHAPPPSPPEGAKPPTVPPPAPIQGPPLPPTEGSKAPPGPPPKLTQEPATPPPEVTKAPPVPPPKPIPGPASPPEATKVPTAPPAKPADAPQVPPPKPIQAPTTPTPGAAKAQPVPPTKPADAPPLPPAKPADAPPVPPPKPVQTPAIPPPDAAKAQPVPPAKPADAPLTTTPQLPQETEPPPRPSRGAETGRRTAVPTSAEPGPGEPKGATPTEFVLPDSTPEPDQAPAIAEGLGAAPVAILPGPPSSDSELSGDAVELITATAEDAGPVPAQSAALDQDQTPRDGIGPGASPAPPEPAAAEPREVDPEAVEMMESAEHQTAPVPPPTKPRTPTPPPVRSESPAVTPPPVPPEVAATRPSLAPPAPTIAAALFDESQTPAATGDHIPEALARRSLQKRSKPWYEEIFDEDYLRTLPFTTPAQTQREVDFIREALSPPKGGEILDIACGYGRHALELAQQGFRMTGLDLSLPLLIRAADDAQRRGLAVNFVHADMREMSFNGQFDAAYCVLSSFGYFDEETNLRVATAICRALKPGGRFLLDILNRDYVVGDLPTRVWWEGDGCVVLEEVDFNYHTSRVLVRRSVVFGNGRQSEQEISLRAYSLHEVGKLLRQAGLRVLQVSGGLATKSRFFGAASRNIIAVCERPAV